MKDPAALLYIDKWISATQGMKVEARGWYMDLILYQFDKGPIPGDLDEMAAICRVRPSEYDLFKQTIKQVLKQKFKLNEDGTYENEFASEIITARKEFKEKRSEAGSIGWIVKLARQLNATESTIDALKEAIFNGSCEYKIEDLKDKQVLKQVLKLYINEDVVVDKPDRITPKELAAEFHNRCPSLKTIKGFSESRTRLVKSRLADSGLERILMVFDKAEASDFLRGVNDRSWRADFDWLLTKKNFDKVIEDKYENPENSQKKPDKLSFKIDKNQ